MNTTTSTRTTVLVIDDAIETRERLCTLLAETPGIDAIGLTADPPAALGRFRRTPSPNGVIIDAPARGAEGIELLAKLRELSTRCLIVVLTGDDTPEFRNRCLAAGAHLFLVKSQEFELAAELMSGLGDRR